MTQLWLIRHGQTDWNATGRWQGQSPGAPLLNALGRVQAEALAVQLSAAQRAGQPFAALYSSDLGRAREMAETIALKVGLSVQIDPRLREIDQGEWEGVMGSEIVSRYPVEWAARENDPLHSRAPGGESLAELAARVGPAIDDIVRHHPRGSVLIVSHGVVVATLLCRVRAVPLALARTLIPDNAHPEVIEWPPATMWRIR